MTKINNITGVPDGQLYNPNYDAEIITRREAAKALCMRYNQTEPSQRQALLQEIAGSVGKNPCIEPPFCCDYGSNIHLGDHFYANHNLVILDGAEVRCGDHVFIAPNVGLYTAGHPLDSARRNAGLEYAKPITLGNNVWIGAGSSVLPGVTIGDGAIIGAGSVVSRDIPANVVAVGNPCKVIREINEADAERTAF